jgi:hypothetical protein
MMIRPHTVRWRPILAAILFGVMLVLAPLAHADPPDASWLVGWWDAADYDDVVVLATTFVGAAETQRPYGTRLAKAVAADVLDTDEPAIPVRPLLSYLTRAPPAS